MNAVRKWCSWLAIAWFVLPAAARADDWLAALPACEGQGGAAVPAFAIAYPRRGLPALVEAGQSLIARVRLPVALTPPPGIQQPRALVGWSAALEGSAPSFPAAAGLRLRYPLAVLDVRPDGASSTLYRAALPLPAWVAPGSYDLVLSAPGGHGRARGGVRVLARGQAPRLAWIAGELPPAGAAVAALPFDAWVRAGDEAGAGAEAGMPPADSEAPDPAFQAAPLLDPTGLTAALRVGRQLWVIGGCRAPHVAFDAEVNSVLAREQRTRMRPPAPKAPGAGFAAWGGAFSAWPGSDALRITPDGDRLRVRAQLNDVAANTGFELRLLVPSDGRGVRASAGALGFYPAGDIAAPALPATAVQLRLGPRADAVLERTPAAARALRLVPEPPAVRSGEVVSVRVQGLPRPARVALRFDGEHTAFEPAAASHAYGELGARRVDALAFAADGAATRLSARVQVRGAHHAGCACALIAGRAAGPPGARPALGLLLVALYLARRCVRKGVPKTRAADRAGIDCGSAVVEDSREGHLASGAAFGDRRRERLRPQEHPEYARRGHGPKSRGHRLRGALSVRGRAA